MKLKLKPKGPLWNSYFSAVHTCSFVLKGLHAELVTFLLGLLQVLGVLKVNKYFLIFFFLVTIHLVSPKSSVQNTQWTHNILK